MMFRGVSGAAVFDVIRSSVKRPDKHDTRAIALFLSKDLLPEAQVKSDEHI